MLRMQMKQAFYYLLLKNNICANPLIYNKSVSISSPKALFVSHVHNPETIFIFTGLRFFENPLVPSRKFSIPSD
jgi:hypothetical protein